MGGVNSALLTHRPSPPLTNSPHTGSGDASGEHTDPKHLRKLRQQQLQQKFRKEMEARKLQQERGRTESEDPELAGGRGGGGGEGDGPSARAGGRASADVHASRPPKLIGAEDCLTGDAHPPPEGPRK